eukprot:gene17722-36309_t
MLKMANLAATIANRGYWVTPHLVRGIGQNGKGVLPEHRQVHRTDIETRHFEAIIGGMQDAVEHGTVGGGAGIVEGIAICGKTGTSQNKKGKDNSIFIAFAPRYNPKIAIAVMVQNAGFGGSVAAPIATLMIEKYLKRKIERTAIKERMLNLSIRTVEAMAAGSAAKPIPVLIPESTSKTAPVVPSKPKKEAENMARDIDIREGIDWTTVWLYAALVFFGWLNIYAAVYNPESPIAIFSTSHNAGKQLLFISSTFVLILIILFVDYKVYDSFAYIFYGFIILLLLATIFLATEIKGSRSWIKLGSTFSLQPAEFSKIFTALALSRYLSTQGVNITKVRDAIVAGLLVFVPPIIIILQKETGSALTFAAFIAVFYREGLPGIYPALGLAVACGLFWYVFLKRY